MGNVRKFVAVSFVVTLFLSITTLSVSASTLGGHGCAPFIPPGVPGTPGPAPAVSGIIVINEVLLSPHSTWNCSESPGTYSLITDTWIELYNTQNQPYNLYAAHAEIDSGPNTNFYHSPFGASIAAHGFLVLFPRYDASFLMTETSTLRLVIGGTVVDQVTVPQLAPDQSYARRTDGASAWQITAAPTIGASNTALQVTPTATSPSSRQNNPGGNSGNSTNNSSSTNVNKLNNAQVVVNGAQPQWNSLQLPVVTPTSDTYTSPSTITTSPLPSNKGLDTPKRIALTGLMIALALAMLWCWRAFFKAPSQELTLGDPPDAVST